MGMISPRILLPHTQRHVLTKEEHPMQEVRGLAEEMGQTMMPPQGGSVIAPQSERELPFASLPSGQSNQATLRLMKSIEEHIQHRGIGRIRISASIWPSLGKPQTPDAWQQALLLPEGWRVEFVEHTSLQILDDTYSVFVSHESIPVIEADQYYPDVVPHYSVLYDQKTGKRTRVELNRIDILQWDGEHRELINAPNSGGDTDMRHEK